MHKLSFTQRDKQPEGSHIAVFSDLVGGQIKNKTWFYWICSRLFMIINRKCDNSHMPPKVHVNLVTRMSWASFVPSIIQCQHLKKPQ